MLYDWNSKNIIIWFSSMMSSSQWLLAQAWRNCHLQRWRLAVWEMFFVRLWFEAIEQILAGNENCSWHIDVSHFTYFFVTMPLKYQNRWKERKVYRTSTMLNRWLSGLKEASDWKSWYYLDLLKFCYWVCFLLCGFFCVKGLQVFQQMLRFKMWTVFVCQLVGFSCVLLGDKLNLRCWNYICWY